MRLLFKADEIAPIGSGWFYVEVSPSKMHEVYEEQKRLFMVDDIATAVEEKIRENGIGDRYAEDWPRRFGERFAPGAVDEVNANEQINELYSDTVSRHVEAGLKSLGINPDTMISDVKKD